MPPSLNDIERKILDYMVQYLRSNTYQPSIREIGERFGIKSTKTVSEHLQALADKGFLERDPSRSRGVRILGVDLSGDTVSVPFYREMPTDKAGVRVDRAEMHLSLDRRLGGNPLRGMGPFWDRLCGVFFFPHPSRSPLDPLGPFPPKDGTGVRLNLHHWFGSGRNVRLPDRPERGTPACPQTFWGKEAGVG